MTSFTHGGTIEIKTTILITTNIWSKNTLFMAIFTGLQRPMRHFNVLIQKMSWMQEQRVWKYSFLAML